MKKAIVLFLFLASQINFGQNTFPSSGNVGIGTTSPQSKLYVQSNMQSNTASRGYSAATFQGNDGILTIGQLLGLGSDNYGMWLQSQSSIETVHPYFPLTLQPIGGNTFINPTSGTVGIGTFDTNSKLAIAGGLGSTIGAGGSSLRIINSDTGNYASISTGIVGLTNAGMQFSTDGSSRVVISAYGNVGIGTTTPNSKLDVRGVISTPEIAFRNADGGDDSDPYRLRKVQSTSNSNWLELQLNDDANESFRIYGHSCEGAGCGEYSNNLYHSFDTQGNVFHSGNVGIGITNPTNKLDVNGTIHSKEVKVDMIGWSDYVFKKEYTLPTLEEVENQIKEKGHLANIPSEEEVLKNGINLGEMNAKLLQKIEELTLYTIEQNKRMNKLEKENQDLKNKIDSIIK